MDQKIYPPIPATPKSYWQDSKWANKNFTDLVKQYPTLRVAIINKKIVAASKVITEVRKIAQQKTNQKSFPVIFAKKDIDILAIHRQSLQNHLGKAKPFTVEDALSGIEVYNDMAPFLKITNEIALDLF